MAYSQAKVCTFPNIKKKKKKKMATVSDIVICQLVPYVIVMDSWKSSSFSPLIPTFSRFNGVGQGKLALYP